MGCGTFEVVRFLSCNGGRFGFTTLARVRSQEGRRERATRFFAESGLNVAFGQETARSHLCQGNSLTRSSHKPQIDHGSKFLLSESFTSVDMTHSIFTSTSFDRSSLCQHELKQY